jgi:aminoglycoside phosphotransferase (APT) family kinase protein
MDTTNLGEQLLDRLREESGRLGINIGGYSHVLPLSFGAYHYNFLVQSEFTDLVLRVNRESQWGLGAHDQLFREQGVLRIVGDLGISPLEFGLVPGNPPFLVESFVHGSPFSYSEANLIKAGTSLALLHSLNVEGQDDLMVAQPQIALLGEGDRWLARASSDSRSDATVLRLRAFRSSITDSGSYGPTALVHTDLIHGNMLVGPERCFFVDWEGARVGPASWDIAYLLSPVTTRWAEGFRELSPSEEESFYDGYGSVSCYPLDAMRRHVEAIMPLVVYRALCWCVGYRAEGRLSTSVDESVRRFTDIHFVDSVLSRWPDGQTL